MPTEDAARQKWLEDTLKRLLTFWNQRSPREISWSEAAGLISEAWLKDHFGTPPTIDIGALRGALIDETPKPSGPPTPAGRPALSKRSTEKKKDSAQVETMRAFLTENGVQPGIPKQKILARIQEWARKKGMAPPSGKTFQRHWKDIVETRT
jgi:hypothetical protein